MTTLTPTRRRTLGTDAGADVTPVAWGPPYRGCTCGRCDRRRWWSEAGRWWDMFVVYGLLSLLALVGFVVAVLRWRVN